MAARGPDGVTAAKAVGGERGEGGTVAGGAAARRVSDLSYRKTDL